MAEDVKEIVYRALYESPIITVHDYCCHIAQGGPGAEEESESNNIVLMRHGAFSRHFGRRTVTADVNQAVFFSRDSTYRARTRSVDRRASRTTVSLLYRTLRQWRLLASSRTGAASRVGGVCDWAINDGGIKVTVAGKEITVCCDECAEKAKEE